MKSEVNIWVDRLQRLSDSGVCDGFVICDCQTCETATITCYCRNKNCALAIRDLIKSNSFSPDVVYEYSTLNGGEQHKVVIFIND